MAMQGMQGAQGQQGTQPQMQAGPTPRINIQEFENKLDAMPDSSLKQLAQNPSYMTNAMYGPLINAELTRRVAARQAKQMQQTPQGQQPTVVQQAQQAAQQLPEDTGIAQLPAQNIANMAGGGIVAFAGGGDMEDGEVEYDPSMDIRQADEDVIALGGDERTTPAERFFKGLVPQPKTLPPSAPSDLQLMDVIKREYEGRAGASGFLFTKQTDEERQQAKDIMRLARDKYSKGDTAGLLAIAQGIPGSSVDPTAKNAVADIGELGYNTNEPTGNQKPRVMPPRAAAAAAAAAAAPRGPAGAAPGAAPAELAATAPGQAAMGAPRSTGVDMLNNLKLDLTGVREQRALDEAEAKKVADLAKQQASEETQAYEKYLAQRGVYGKGREERIAQREAELPKRREEAQGMALLQAGLAILSAPPGRGAMAAIGAGAQSGLKMYQGDIEKLQAASEKLQSARDSLEDARYSQQTADETERRRLKSMERRAEMDGAKAMQEIASRYGMTLSMAEAKSKFDISLEQAKLQTKIDEENIQQAGALQRTLINERGANTRAAMATTRAGGLDEAAKLRLKAIDDFTDPSKRILIKQQFPNVKTFDDYLTALGLPLKNGTGVGTSAFPGASIVGSRKD
jgi:hypothetical protein